MTGSLTIGRRQHHRLVRDLVWQIARRRSTPWWFAAAVVVLFLRGLSLDHPIAAVLVALGLVGLQLLVWWARAARRCRHGLAEGQTVSTEWAADGELVVTDATGQYRLPRGSVMVVRRAGGNANVYGRSMSFVLPRELLTEQDIAFLEGHAAAPAPAGAPHVDLPRSLTITQEVQDHLVDDATRRIVRTAEFALPLITIGLFALLGLLTPLWGFLVVAAICAVPVVPSLVRFARWRKAYRELFPVGRTLHAEITSEHLALSRTHGTAVLTWDNFDRASATDHNVLLRHRRERFGSFQWTVLPIGLFLPEDIHQIAAAVRGRRQR